MDYKRLSDLATGASTPPVWVDENTILVLGAKRGATRVWRVDAGSGDVTALTPDDQRVMQFAVTPDGKHLMLVAGDTDRPFRLFRANANGSDQESIFDPNEELIDETWLSTPMDIEAVAPDGGEVQAWLLPPRGLDPDASVKYPLIVQIHGGAWLIGAGAEHQRRMLDFGHVGSIGVHLCDSSSGRVGLGAEGSLRAMGSLGIASGPTPNPARRPTRRRRVPTVSGPTRA